MDGFDLLILGFMLRAISAELHLTPPQAGSLITWTLIGAVVGGILFGILSDYYGRVRVLTWTILLFAIFTGLGASATVRLTRRKMRRLGIRSVPAGPRPATREHPLGLTRREREVLDLICAGLTNAEIAGKLFISVKTAGHHVSAVLAKLGVPTRGAAAYRAARLSLVATPASTGTHWARSAG